MSAAANSSSAYQTAQRLADNNSMSVDGSIGISVISRIDYNLRFAKQVVLVIGNNAEQYSQLASQFLVSLSNVKPASSELNNQDTHINVAFVPASTKLNDIQIRCRLIEQLFVNTLFDPEQSLAISVLRFAKQQGEAISIVIDHAQSLSLQIKYELCQLVSLAKKNKLTINVVIFGLTEAAQQLAINKSLFTNKMAIIDAGTGQVISLDDKRIIHQKDVSPLTLWQKISLMSAMVLLAAALIWIYLLIAEDVNDQAFNTTEQTVLTKTSLQLVLPSKLVDSSSNKSVRPMQKKYKTEVVKNSAKLNEINLRSQATSEEINHVLLSHHSVNSVEKMPAEAVDVLKALVIADIKVEADVVIPTSNDTATEIRITEVPVNYYQAKAKEYEQGYVVQIAGFSDNKLLERFLLLYPQEGFHSYKRELNGKSFTVITSKVYQNKAEAKATIQLLPIQLIERKPWVKSISSVITEINTFKR